jgi:hypothetical protein
MFGREFKGLVLGTEGGIDPASNNPLVLQKELNGLRERPAEAAPAAPDPSGPAPDPDDAFPPGPDASQAPDNLPRLARIYGFSYLGSYFKMANPPVMRVYGPGYAVRTGFSPENPMDIVGVEFKDEDFVAGIRMWAADQLDVAVRIDITIGWLREILLDSDMTGDANVTGSGISRSDVVGRDSGMVGRDSGMVGRDSGMVGRDSGFVGRSRR